MILTPKEILRNRAVNVIMVSLSVEFIVHIFINDFEFEFERE